MGASSGFEFFEHTADIGIRAWGPDMASALTQASRALMQLLTGGDFASLGRAQFTVELQAAGVEDLVVAWLQELLVRFELEQLVPETCVFHELTPLHLRATVEAQRCDTARGRLGHEVKAVTYHQLRVAQGPDGCRLDMIVDV